MTQKGREGMMAQEGKVQSHFNYSTLNVSLQKSQQSLIVELHRPHLQNRINQEMLFELESLFSWVTQHLEIQSILLTSSSSHFGEGLDTKELQSLDRDRVQKFLSRLQKLIYSLTYLPQTVVVDLKSGASGASLELSIGADIRISHPQALLHFNHLSNGWIPCCGGLGLLGMIIPKSFVKNWILSSSPISTSELINSGFLHQTYDSSLHDDRPLWQKILQQIKNQGPIQRIQAKRAILESLLHELDKTLQWEKNIGQAGLVTEDWREVLKATEEKRPPTFTGPKDLARLLKYLKFMKKEDCPSV